MNKLINQKKNQLQKKIGKFKEKLNQNRDL